MHSNTVDLVVAITGAVNVAVYICGTILHKNALARKIEAVGQQLEKVTPGMVQVFEQVIKNIK